MYMTKQPFLPLWMITMSLLTSFPFLLRAQDTSIKPQLEIQEIFMAEDSALQHVIRDPMIYYEGWDTLAQPRFWQSVMNLNPDFSVLNVAKTRQILCTFPTVFYDTLKTEAKQAFKDSMCQVFGLPPKTPLYVTCGKSDYYQHRKVIPAIGKAIEIFAGQETDPWYAQAILLIESPGQIRRSKNGAYGSFQLMRSVAIREGLTVDHSQDERKDFDRSAWAAARFIKRVCLPETRKLLDTYGLSYEETDLWFRLMVLHVYHAGAGNVRSALATIVPRVGGMSLIRTLWTTEARGFRNASQNYSQVALASLLELDRIIDEATNLKPEEWPPLRPLPPLAID